MSALLIATRHPAYRRCRRAAQAGRWGVVKEVLEQASPEEYDQWCFRLALLALEIQSPALLEVALTQPKRMRLHGHVPSGPYQGLGLLNVALRTHEPGVGAIMWAVEALLKAGMHSDYRLKQPGLPALPLHHAVRVGDAPLAELFLKHGAHPQALRPPQQSQGTVPSALLYARSCVMVKLLLEHGADPQALNASKESPMQAIVHETLSIDELVDWVKGWSRAGVDVDLPLSGLGSPSALAFYLSEPPYSNPSKARLRFTEEHLRRVDAFTVALVQNGARLDALAADGRSLLEWAKETAGPSLMAWVRHARLEDAWQRPSPAPAARKRM